MKPLVFLLLLTAAAPLLAQPTRRPTEPTYDPATVETLRGFVRSVEVQPSRYGPFEGVHLTVEVGDAVFPVHLGPVWYLDRQDRQVRVGDEVVVVGSRVVLDGVAVVIAAEVRLGEAVLVLRDRAGTPVWRGWRHGRR